MIVQYTQYIPIIKAHKIRTPSVREFGWKDLIQSQQFWTTESNLCICPPHM